MERIKLKEIELKEIIQMVIIKIRVNQKIEEEEIKILIVQNNSVQMMKNSQISLKNILKRIPPLRFQCWT